MVKKLFIIVDWLLIVQWKFFPFLSPLFVFVFDCWEDIYIRYSNFLQLSDWLFLEIFPCFFFFDFDLVGFLSFFSTCPRSMFFPSDKDDGWLTLSYFCLYRPFCRLLLFSVLASGSRAEIAFTPPRKPVFVMLEFPAR